MLWPQTDSGPGLYIHDITIKTRAYGRTDQLYNAQWVFTGRDAIIAIIALAAPILTIQAHTSSAASRASALRIKVRAHSKAASSMRVAMTASTSAGR